MAGFLLPVSFTTSELVALPTALVVLLPEPCLHMQTGSPQPPPPPCACPWRRELGEAFRPPHHLAALRIARQAENAPGRLPAQAPSPHRGFCTACSSDTSSAPPPCFTALPMLRKGKVGSEPCSFGFAALTRDSHSRPALSRRHGDVPAAGSCPDPYLGCRAARGARPALRHVLNHAQQPAARPLIWRVHRVPRGSPGAPGR